MQLRSGMPRSQVHSRSPLRFTAAWFIVWLSASISTQAFNLEPESAQIFSYPTAGQLNSGRESYFGFSIALQKNGLDNSNWLIVGAPRANSSRYSSSQIREPGAIFKCDLQRDKSPCQELRIDRTGNTMTSQYQDYKNFGWLGASLDSQPSLKEDRQATATCAPRWENQYYMTRNLMNGACYWLNASLQDAPAHKFIPLLNSAKQTYHTRGRNLFYYSHGQAGISIHFPDTPNEMLIGAPGIFNWQGSVILMKDSNPDPDANTSRQPSPKVPETMMFTSLRVPNPYYTASIEDFDLFGYAVTSGRFFNKDELLYATGGPNSASAHGKVLIFSFPSYDEQPVGVRAEWVGSQLGENFGSSLVAADVNGDGLSDLIVGSPTYSESNKPDVGRIQVFTGTGEGNIVKIGSSHSGSVKSLARFGTTLASPGDINQDRYEDVAVGAPWEDDGKGAVYIYLGSIYGLRNKFSQRLTPYDFPSHSLRGFGMSLSRGIDIDNNGYPDLAIGSFMSGHALVLRSRTVASLTGHLVSKPPALALDTTEFTLTACLSYTGYNVPASIDVPAQLTLDYGHHSPRASFLDTKRMVMNLTLKATTTRLECKSFQVSVEANKVDPRRPIIVSFEYGFPDIPGERLKLPTTDNNEPKSFNYSIRILTDCEDNGDNICQTDMHVEADFKNYRKDEHLVIGGIKRPELEISVSNLGESVFLPNVTISVSEPFVLFMPISHSCEFAKDKRSRLVCQLISPIQKETKDILTVIIDPSQVTDAIPIPNLIVDVEVAGEGTEISELDNRISAEIQLSADAELKLNGYSRGETVFYSRLDEDTINTTEPTASFTHHYSLVKSGPSPLERVELIIDIPVNLTDVSFIALYTPKTNFLDQSFYCNIKGAIPKISQFGNGGQGNDIDALTPNDEERSAATKVKRSNLAHLIEFNEETGLPHNSSHESPQVFSCTNSKVSCAQVRCLINSWPGDTRSASLSIRMDVNLRVLASHISARVGASVMSSARASIVSLNPQLIFQGNKNTSAVIETDLVPLSLPVKRVAWWIIFIPIMCGLLLLLLLALILYKVGFFRRKKQEEMKAHRAHVESHTNYGATNEDQQS
ncbi:integrin alpha-PS3-like [Palaemon carinicauda]|uniref:integrin alpha-PS3-like n=1 Tax=Palaemon carinicauda TaxID=392227 RepID=UPI0035B5B6DD